PISNRGRVKNKAISRPRPPSFSKPSLKVASVRSRPEHFLRSAQRSLDRGTDAPDFRGSPALLLGRRAASPPPPPPSPRTPPPPTLGRPKPVAPGSRAVAADFAVSEIGDAVEVCRSDHPSDVLCCDTVTNGFTPCACRSSPPTSATTNAVIKAYFIDDL